MPVNSDDTRQKLESALASASEKEKFQIYQMIASHYQVRGDIAKSVESLKQAESHGQANADLLFNIAAMHEQLGDKSNALEYYRKTARNLEENNTEAVRAKEAFKERVNAKIKELEAR